MISATLFVALGTPATVTKTVPKVTTTTETTTLTRISTQYETITSPGNASLLANCLTSEQVNVPWFGTLVAKNNSPAIICVQLYAFNSTSLITVNTSGLITIQGSQPTPGNPNGRESVSGAGNFTVVASQNQVLLGGPTNADAVWKPPTIAYAMYAAYTKYKPARPNCRGFKLSTSIPFLEYNACWLMLGIVNLTPETGRHHQANNPTERFHSSITPGHQKEKGGN